MPIVSVARDPFARGEYLRHSLSQKETRESCAWCGSTPRTLYRYAWVDDGANRHPWWGRAFCNIQCRHAYHDSR